MAKTDPRLDVSRAPRTDDEKALLREMKDLRATNPGVLYTGSRKNEVKVDGQPVTVTRYLFEVDAETARLVITTLSGTSTKATTRKARTATSGGSRKPSIADLPGPKRKATAKR
jgi:hypothetical protein